MAIISKSTKSKCWQGFHFRVTFEGVRELNGSFSYSLKNYLLDHLFLLLVVGDKGVIPEVTEFVI